MASNINNLPVIVDSPSPSRLSRERTRSLEPADSAGTTTSKRQSRESLVDLHRLVVKRFRTEHYQPRDRLSVLQHERTSLCAQVAEKRARSYITVHDELRQRQQPPDRPYLQIWKTTNHLSSADQRQVVADRDVSIRMKQLRHVKKIAAAYRVAGISILPIPEKEILAIRFDVQYRGLFVGCYHAFFDLVVYEPLEEDVEEDAQEEDKMFLRLIQHTLPPSVPLGAILEKTMGGMACVGAWNDHRQWKTLEIQEKLQNCAKEIYQACYCLCVRKHAENTLKSYAKNDSGTNRDGEVKNLQCSDRRDKITFQLASGSALLEVKLFYRDPMQAQPTNVKVKNLVAPSTLRDRRQEYSTGISDDEEDDDEGNVRDELVETAKISFLRLEVEDALSEVVGAMSEFQW